MRRDVSSMSKSGVSTGALGRLLSRLVLVLVVSFAVLAPRTASAEVGPVIAGEMRLAADASRARLVVQLDGEPGLKWFFLRNPHRLVIDFGNAQFAPANPPEVRGMITDLQYGRLDPAVSRLILSADGPFVIEHFEMLANETSPGHRLVVDLVIADEARFEQALADQIETTGSTRVTEKGDRLRESARDRARPFTIVLDPGHGGIDSGAEGVRGTLEKTITLAFGLELKTALERTGLYRVQMTRDRDDFLTLDERVRVARQHEADLFISIHADAIRLKGMRGATVYTVADRASDAAAAAKAIRENLSDHVAGIEVENESQQVADILVDLVRRETQSFSLRFARTLVGSLSPSVEMVNNPHRFAGFKVLRAPDVPSVLLELGYLSNEQDEAQLRDPEWRANAISSILDAIAVFSEGRVSAVGG
jgi:N-acetylmuramoyl-L-alanine amidase